MPHVNIYKLKNDGSQEILAACHLKDNRVICESNSSIFIDNLSRDGIIDYTSPKRKRLFFSDGRKFLKQLKFNFQAAYLNASDIIEE